jgi:chorismate dehydratase
LSEGFQLIGCVPRAFGMKAAAGEVAAGPLPLVDYFRLQEAFERLGHFGIAVRGRAQSALLFARKPIRQLDGATIAVTEETSTTACLLRLLLEQRHHLGGLTYRRGDVNDADAVLLIGDEALRFSRTTTQYSFEIDVGFEWWLWQHLPFVFAVWVVRKDLSPDVKKAIELGVSRTLAKNLKSFDEIAAEYSPQLDIPAADLHTYLSNFVYRLGQAEEEGIRRFKELVDEHDLL